MRSNLASYALKSRLIVLLISFFSVFLPLPCLSEDGTQEQLSELLQMDINELMDLKVTLPSRLEERQFDSAAAVYVITQEDIRRSGLTRIPELLRMVPGLHVGQIDNSTLAVSSRSDMVWLSNSMLVLLDGRTLYNPLFGGVYWDVQDTLIQDIERIEVIRGPGGSLWGANAFDGIINIVTKSSEKTNATLLYGGYGTGDREYEAGIRFGSQLANYGSGRVYAKSSASEKGIYLDADQSTNDGFFPPGSDAFDDGTQDQAGFRIDLEFSGDATLTIQGDVYNADYNNLRVRQPHENTVAAKGRNIIVNWNKHSGLSSFNIKLFYDYTKRIENIFEEQRDIYDLDFQHSQKFERHILTWGLGYRYTSDDTMQAPMGVFTLDPASLSDNLYSAFIQDQIELSKNLVYLTIGSKFENNDYTGYEYQPTLRLLWKQSTQTTLWGSITRAVRTPSRAELHGKLIVCDPIDPNCVINIGSPNQDSDSVIASEIGYRTQFTESTLFDLALFNNNYDDAIENSGQINTYGVEALIKYIFSKDWRLESSFAYHKGTRDDNGNEVNNNRIPKNTFHFRSFWNFQPNWEFDALFYYASHLDVPIVAPKLKDTTRLDLRLGWNPNNALRTTASITNVFDQVQGEALELQRINTGTGRGIFIAVEYSFN
ncbi:TonB-dependent receptor plug domain-containing protein [Kaarinaea lacus]